MSYFDDWIAEGYIKMDENAPMDILYDIMELLEEYGFKCGIDATQGSHKEITVFNDTSLDECIAKKIANKLKEFKEYIKDVKIQSKAIQILFETSIYMEDLEDE